MVRGNIRRGGMGRGGMGGRGGSSNFKKSFIPRHPFDLSLIDPIFFPKVSAVMDDSALISALTKRNQDLSPTAAEQSSLANLVTKVQGVLDNLVVDPGKLSCQFEEVRLVGSYKKGTMLTGNNVADIVVLLKTLPTKESCDALSKKVDEDLKTVMKTEVITKLDQINILLTEKGFDVFNWQARVRVLITTLPQNIRKLEPEIHLDSKSMQLNLSMLRHSRWFEENASHSSIKVLIRVLRDLTTRFEAFSPLNTWLIDLLAHFAIMNNPSRQALPINSAFRRVFQLLASGLFLPGSSGISDPCEVGHIRVHTILTLEQQDNLCMSAQTILRILMHGGYKAVLEADKKDNLITEMSVWDGVVVSPLELAYEKPAEKKDGEDEDMEAVESVNEDAEDLME